MRLTCANKLFTYLLLLTNLASLPRFSYTLQFKQNTMQQSR